MTAPTIEVRGRLSPEAISALASLLLELVAADEAANRSDGATVSPGRPRPQAQRASRQGRKREPK